MKPEGVVSKLFNFVDILSVPIQCNGSDLVL